MSTVGERETRIQQRVVAFFQDALGCARLVFLDTNLVRTVEKYRKLFDGGGKQVLT